MTEIWDELRRTPRESADIDGHIVRAGSRVRLRPRQHGDILDHVLDGQLATVEGLDEDLDGAVHVAVTIDEDPGRDLGEGRYPGHRFFFRVDEVEPLDEPTPRAVRAPRILIAGIGNIFLSDDGFGVAVAQQLANVALPRGVEVRDFGIRGMDLAYAMQKDYDAVILIDIARRGAAPGTLSVLDASADLGGPPVIETHAMDPVKVLALARALGRVPNPVYVVACEPARVPTLERWDEMDMTMSDDVTRAIPEAVALLQSLVDRLLNEMASDPQPTSAAMPTA